MADSDEIQGRRRHLTKLLAVFKRANMRYEDLHDFVGDLLRGANGVGYQGAGFGITMPCRHGLGGKHFDTLQSANPVFPGHVPAAGTVFDHPRYWKPCLGFGQGDANKSPGVVVFDLLTRAVRWTRDRRAGRHGDWRVHHNGNGASLIVEDFGAGAINQAEEAEIAAAVNEVERAMMGPTVHGHPSTSGYMGLPVEAQYYEDVGIPSPATVSTGIFSSPAFASRFSHNSDPSLRSSTKMRMATLTILLSGGRDHRFIRHVLNLLLYGGDAVLHLCGDGIKHTNASGVNCSGCVEPSHLELGAQSTNLIHEIWHKAFNQCQVADYRNLVAIAHRSDPNCARIF